MTMGHGAGKVLGVSPRTLTKYTLFCVSYLSLSQRVHPGTLQCPKRHLDQQEKNKGGKKKKEKRNFLYYQH